MKRVVTFLLAVLMLVTLFVVPASARGYTLSIPASVSSHNLEAYGLHTMEVYETDVAPSIDGKISTGEYPGPNNGCSLSSVPGDNLWMGAYNVKSNSGDQDTYDGRFDFTDYVLEEDKPEYINSYLTYDDEWLYFAVTTTIPAIRFTTATDNEVVLGGGARRKPFWWIDTMVAFMQTDNVAACSYNSVAQTRYNLFKYDYYNQAQQASVSYRKLTLIDETNDDNYVDFSFPNWVDQNGTTWNYLTYARPENFLYQVTVLDNGKWAVTFEGRQPLGDILRITDVEYEDGSPIDYVPEWGTWGCNLRLQSTGDITSTLPNGTEVTLLRDDVIYAQTMLPGYGQARTSDNSKVAGILFNNIVGSAVESGHGRPVYYLANPVHFLGKYDESFDYGSVYDETTGVVLATTTSRVTRTRSAVLTSGVRGVNYRVIGVATSSAGATGDSVTLTVVLSGVMLLCAGVAVSIFLMKKRCSGTR